MNQAIIELEELEDLWGENLHDKVTFGGYINPDFWEQIIPPLGVKREASPSTKSRQEARRVLALCMRPYSHPTRSRQEVKKSSSLVYVTLQSPHKIKTRSKEEFQPCVCDLAVTPQKKNQNQESSSH
jgi:hypothetical protein